MLPALTTSSDAYDVSGAMIRARLGCTVTTLGRYQNRNLIPRGKRRLGVRGIFFTSAQANRLLSRLGSTAERFNEF